MDRLHVLVLLAAMACTGLVMGTVKAEAAGSGKELRAAVNTTVPSFAFMENGKLVGFEVDLHAEVAKRMGKQPVMTNIPSAGFAPGLQAKEWDAAGNTWINKERLVMMDSSDPWVDAQLAFVTRRNDVITSPEQLKGKTVGIEMGTAEQCWLNANQEKYGPYTIRTYDRSIDILMDLMNRRLDAYLREQTRAFYQIKNYPMFGVVFPVGDVFVQGVALRKGDPLCDEYNTILNSMKQDGMLAALYEKWLGTKSGPNSSIVHVYTTPWRPRQPLQGGVPAPPFPAEDAMQAENTHSWQKWQRLWYQRDGFLWGLVVALITAAWGLLSPAGTLLGIGGWPDMGLYTLLAVVPMIVITVDERRPQLAGMAAALGFLGLLRLVLYRCSGAQWGMLGMMFSNRELIVETWSILSGGLENTLLIFIRSAVLSVTITPITAIIRTLNNPIFNYAIDAFVNVFHSLSILVLVIFIYYALPFLGIHSTLFAAGMCGLFLSALTFMIEYFRTGIESVSRGHVEAVRSLGLGMIQTMRPVILPLTIRVVLPPLTGHLVGLPKATAFVSVVGMPELLRRTMETVEWKANPTPLVTIVIMYPILFLPLMYGNTLLERRLAGWTTPHST